MRNRIAAFVSLPLATIDRISLQRKLRDSGAMEGSTLRASVGTKA
jgi:arsenate reductase